MPGEKPHCGRRQDQGADSGEAGKEIPSPQEQRGPIGEGGQVMPCPLTSTA